MVYNGYYKVMSNIPKMGQLPTPEKWRMNFPLDLWETESLLYRDKQMGGMILCWLYPTCDSTASHVFFGAPSHWGSFSSSSHAKLDRMLDASNKDDSNCLPLEPWLGSIPWAKILSADSTIEHDCFRNSIKSCKQISCHWHVIVFQYSQNVHM